MDGLSLHKLQMCRLVDVCKLLILQTVSSGYKLTFLGTEEFSNDMLPH